VRKGDGGGDGRIGSTDRTDGRERWGVGGEELKNGFSRSVRNVRIYIYICERGPEPQQPHSAHCLFTVLNKKRIYYAKWLNIINNKLFR